MAVNMSEPVQLRCPKCGRFLTEVTDGGRAPCPGCGSEIAFLTKAQRRLGAKITITGQVTTSD